MLFGLRTKTMRRKNNSTIFANRSLDMNKLAPCHYGNNCFEVRYVRVNSTSPDTILDGMTTMQRQAYHFITQCSIPLHTKMQHILVKLWCIKAWKVLLLQVSHGFLQKPLEFSTVMATHQNLQNISWILNIPKSKRFSSNQCGQFHKHIFQKQQWIPEIAKTDTNHHVWSHWLLPQAVFGIYPP